MAVCGRLRDSQFGADSWGASAWLDLWPAADHIVGFADYERVQSDRWIGRVGCWFSALLDRGCFCDVADSAKSACSILSDRAYRSDTRFPAIQFLSRVDLFGRFGKFVHRIHVSRTGPRGIGESTDDGGGSDSYRSAGPAQPRRRPRRDAPFSGWQTIVHGRSRPHPPQTAEAGSVAAGRSVGSLR